MFDQKCGEIWCSHAGVPHEDEAEAFFERWWEKSPEFRDFVAEVGKLAGWEIDRDWMKVGFGFAMWRFGFGEADDSEEVNDD